jgi:hypothetical protein
MKATERHELATNELAQAIGSWSTRIKPYVGYFLIALVLIAVAIFVYQNRAKDTDRKNREALLGLMPAEQASAGLGGSRADDVTKQIQGLEEYIKNYPSSSLIPLAKLNLANRHYDHGLLLWAEGKEKDVGASDNDLTVAEELYKELVKEPGRIGLEAQYSLACTIAERGNKQEAEKQLLDLAKAHPGTDIETRANSRLDVLRNSKPLVFAPLSGAAVPLAPAFALQSGSAVPKSIVVPASSGAGAGKPAAGSK